MLNLYVPKRIWYIKQVLITNIDNDIISIIIDYLNEFIKEE